MVGPLATVREPHSWDLCLGHANRITAPRGWELVRHAAPLPTNPDEDDLVALAEAVRENGASAGVSMPAFSDPHGAAHASAPRPADSARIASVAQRPAGTGRRRGHLRVLPDPVD